MEKETYNIKSISKKRIIDEIIKNTVMKCSGLGTVLILDEETSLTLNNFVTLPDLIENGVTVIENISKIRKRYKNFVSIYLLAPTKENIHIINKDFKDKKLYKELNIYFTKRITDENFGYIRNMPGVLKAKNLKEINLNFNIETESIFTVKKNNLEDKIDSLISVVSTFKNISSIEVLKLEKDVYKDAEKIYLGVCQRVSDMLKVIKPTNNYKDGGNLTIFVLERGFDIVSPLVHDFFYENLLVDVMDIDFTNIEMKNKVYKIDEKDMIFKKYRYSFINEAMKGIDLDFKKFMKENATARAQKKKNLNINQMQNVLGSLNDYNAQVAQFGCHLGLIEKVLEKIDNENIKETTDSEIAIVTAVNEDGSKIDSNKRIILTKNQMKLVRRDQRILPLDLRLALLAGGSIHRDVSNLGEMLNNNSKTLFYKYMKLVDKFGKYWPEQVKNILINKVKERYNNSQTSLERYLTKIEFLLGEYLINNNDEQFEKRIFGKKNMSNKTNTLFKAKIKKNNKNAKNKVIVFVDGGISLLEIRALVNLQKKSNNSFEIVYGSNIILSPDLFLKTFIKESKVKSNVITF